MIDCYYLNTYEKKEKDNWTEEMQLVKLHDCD